MTEPQETKSSFEADYELLDILNARPTDEDELTKFAVEELGGTLLKSEMEDGKIISRTATGGYTDGKTLVERGANGQIEITDQDGNKYDKDWNLLTYGQKKEA